MAIIDLPASGFSRIDWTLPFPREQMNESEFTTAIQTIQLPGTDRWRAQLVRDRITGETEFQPWRAFLFKAQGSLNSFRVRATVGAQHSGNRPHIANAPFITPTNVSGTSVALGTVTRSAATDGLFAAARTSTALASGVEVSFYVPTPTSGSVHIGFNATTGTSAGGDHPDWYWRFTSGGLVQAVEAGVTIGSAFHDPKDRYALRYEGTVVQLWRNGVLQHGFTTTGGQSFYAEFDIIAQNDSVRDIAFGIPTQPTTSLRVTGLPNGLISGALIPAGALMTVPLRSGDEQILGLPSGLTGDANGRTEVTVDRTLRSMPAPGTRIETINPTCLMCLEPPFPTVPVVRGPRFSLSMRAREAF